MLLVDCGSRFGFERPIVEDPEPELAPSNSVTAPSYHYPFFGVTAPLCLLPHLHFRSDNLRYVCRARHCDYRLTAAALAEDSSEAAALLLALAEDSSEAAALSVVGNWGGGASIVTGLHPPGR